MKCLKCGTVNNKNNLKCKKCGEELHVLKEEIEKNKIEEIKENKEEVKIASTFKEKKKTNIFRKLWTLIKILILLIIISLVGLIVYVYCFYDYKQYFTDNMNRYYKTESSKYIENMKLVFKVYGYDDEKIEMIQDNSQAIVEEWLDEIKENSNSKDEEYYLNLEYLQGIIEALYNDTAVNDYTAIDKKTYISINYQINKLLYEKEIDEKNNELDDESEKEEENNKEEDKEEKNENCIAGYDTSKMENVDLEGILNLFDSKDIYVLYIGRCDCSACAKYLPTLNQVAEEYDFKIQYYDYNKVDYSDENYDKVINKLTKEYELNFQGETKKEMFGYWMGYTPMTIIIKDGKQVDGAIGSIDYKTLTRMLENNGINKK